MPPIVNVSAPVMAPQLITPFDAGGVGGTSGGGAGAGANVLSLNVGGFNLNYDLGPDTEHFANSGYDYLKNSFSADENLVGQTIVGSQNFLEGFAAPLEQFNTTQLPAMFATLGAQNYSLGTQAVQAEAGVARASVAASSAATAQASSGGGFCYITTAVCELKGEADDGPTLTALRRFRDSFMQETEGRRAMVAWYYDRAPVLLARIRERRDSREFLEWLYVHYIMPARDCIERGMEPQAFKLYCNMLAFVESVVGEEREAA